MALLALAFSATYAFACQIPVFRYALERWEPGRFTVQVLHRGPLTEQQQGLVDRLQALADDETSPANLTVAKTDLDAEPTDPLGSRLVELASPTQYPWVAVRFPKGTRTDRLAWSGPLDQGFVDSLVDSPARRAIAKRVLDGDSAVWVLIDGENPVENDAADALLKKQLKAMQEKLELPDLEEIEAEDEYQEETQVELRLSFSSIRIARDDPAEQLFVSMLLGSENDLHEFTEPIAIPIFGRGRTYFALVAGGINPEMIEENCRFLIGPCSCQVKEQNPGADLLFAVDWNRMVVGDAAPSRPAPELTGLGALMPTDQAASASENGSAVSPQASQPTETGPTDMVEEDSKGVSAAEPASFAMPITIVVLLGIAVVAVGTLVLFSLFRPS